MKTTRLTLVMALTVIPFATHAQTYKIEDWDVRLNLMTSSVLSPTIKDQVIDLTPPPAPGTPAYERNLSEALEINLSPKSPYEQAYVTSSSVFNIADALIADGVLPPPENAGEFWKILDRAYLDVSLLSLQQKKKFATLRPSDAKSGFDVLIETPRTPSYPSLIAADMRLFTGMIAMLTDLCLEENRSYATQMKNARIHAGVSTPVDINGGVELGDWYLEYLPEGQDWARSSRSAAAEIQSFYSAEGCVRPG